MNWLTDKLNGIQWKNYKLFNYKPSAKEKPLYFKELQKKTPMDDNNGELFINKQPYIRWDDEMCSKEVKDYLYKSDLPEGVFRNKDGSYTVTNDLWQPEFFDVLKVLEFGAKKHGKNNWLQSDGKKSSFKDMHNSMFHHIAESYVQGLYGIDGFGEGNSDFDLGRGDKESGLDPLLHATARVIMEYVLIKRKLKHTED